MTAFGQGMTAYQSTVAKNSSYAKFEQTYNKLNTKITDTQKAAQAATQTLINATARGDKTAIAYAVQHGIPYHRADGKPLTYVQYVTNSKKRPALHLQNA